MNYLQLLDIKENAIELVERINSFEEKNKITIPPVFKSFLKTFSFEKIGRKDLLSYYNQKYNVTIQFYESHYLKNDHIILKRLFSLEEIYTIMEKVYLANDEVWTKNLLAIGECNDQGFLMLGIGQENNDRIYIEYAHTEERIGFLADNIIDFFQGYEIIPMESDLPVNAKLSDLYKKWGEDFWTVSSK